MARKRKIPPNDSFTRLNTFTEVCERRYLFDALYGEWKDSPATIEGSKFHGFMEEWARQVKGGNTWEGTADYNHPLWKKYGPRMLPFVKHLVPTSVEEWFHKKGGCPRNLVGKIDLISSTLPDGTEGPCLLDWKRVGGLHRVQEEWAARKSLQLQIYALVSEIPTVGFVYVLPSGPPVPRIVTFSPEELRVAARRLQMIRETLTHRWKIHLDEDFFTPIQDNWAPAAPSQFLCSRKYCEHYNRCFKE